MPTETLEQEVSEHNPEGVMPNGASPAVNEMFSKLTSQGMTRWNMGEPAEQPGADDKTPADEKEKPEGEKATPAKGAVAAPDKPAVEAKAPEAKVEPPAAIDPLTLELPRTASDKAGKNFGIVKAALKETMAKLEPTEKKLQAAIAEIESLKKNGNTPADYEQIKKERGEFEEIIKVSTVERHPDFIRYFSKKVEEATNLAVDIAGADNKAAVEAALKMQDGPAKDAAIDEILSLLPQYKAVQLGAALAQFPAIERERQSELKKAPESYAKLEQQKAATAAEQTKQSQERMAADLKLAETAALELESFKEIEGNAEHNSQVANRKAFLKEFHSGNINEKMRPLIPVMVADYLHLKNTVFPNMNKQITAMQEQLKSLQKAAPALPSGGKKADESAALEGEGFTAHFARLTREARGI